MPHSFKRATRLWRHMLFTSIAALGGMSITACSSDSDGEFIAAGNGEVIILPTYIYQISATPAGNPLRVNVPDEAGMRTVSIHFGNTLNGRVNVSVDLDNNATVSNYSLHSQSSLAVNSNVGIPFLGAFVINVTEDMQFLVGEPPTTGALEITTLTETVTLRGRLEWCRTHIWHGRTSHSDLGSARIVARQRLGDRLATPCGVGRRDPRVRIRSGLRCDRGAEPHQ